jgi:tetratricopeptide (TPR) repeat protein
MEILRATPGDVQSRAELALNLAILGRKDEAIREAQRAVALAPIASDGYSAPYYEHLLARTYLLVGEPEKALDALEPLLKVPYFLSRDWLKIDPTFDSLRGNPRFQRLIASS